MRSRITLCLVALAGAGLFIHSLHNAQLVDPGFETKHEVFAFANLPPKYTAQQAMLYYQQVLDRVKALPMVAEAGISSNAPFNGTFSSNMFPEGTDRSDPRNGRQTPTPTVMPGFFSAAGIPLLSGRDFTDHDNGQTEKVAILNQAAAEQFWPGQSAIGKHTGMAMVLGGIGAGWLLTLALTHSLNSLLYGIGIFDPISFFATAVLMIALALLACWIPSRRAMNVSPVIALRYE